MLLTASILFAHAFTMKMTFSEIVIRDGVSVVAKAVGRSRRYIQQVLRGDRAVSRDLLLRTKKAYPEFSADADIEAELVSEEDPRDAA